jgi:hypothetical protein
LYIFRAGKKEEYLLPALELLNARAGDFDAAKVLEMIPPNWSVSVVEAFLRGALRKSLHKVGTVGVLQCREIYLCECTVY